MALIDLMSLGFSALNFQHIQCSNLNILGRETRSRERVGRIFATASASLSLRDCAVASNTFNAAIWTLLVSRLRYKKRVGRMLATASARCYCATAHWPPSTISAATRTSLVTPPRRRKELGRMVATALASLLLCHDLPRNGERFGRMVATASAILPLGDFALAFNTSNAII